MICTYCNTGVKMDWCNTFHYIIDDKARPKIGQEIIHGTCPECDEIIIKLIEGPVMGSSEFEHVRTDATKKEQTLYPISANRPIPKEVNDPYKADYQEASSILNLSPKASAAISRRILQSILRDKYRIKKKNLYKEIECIMAIMGSGHVN